MKFKKSFLLALIAPLFLFANAAHAVQLGSYDCSFVTGVQTVTGHVGDTIYITDTGGQGISTPCSITLTGFSGPSQVPMMGNGTYTATTVGSDSISWTGAGVSGSVTATITSNSSGTPSLSQWAQILLALLAVGTMAWYYRKQRQTH